MSLKESLPRVLNLAWAQIILAFGCGIALSYYFEANGKYEVLHHIGIGLIVAAAVTTFWQFREFEEFFARFSRRILVEDAYLEKLKVPALTSLRSRAGRSILKNYVTNPAYERDSLSDWIDDLLYHTLLPGQSAGSGMYRDHYQEDIYIEHVNLQKALSDVKAPTAGISAARLAEMVLKVTTISTFQVIAPRLSDAAYSHYTVAYSGKGADMSDFPLDKRISVRVGNSISQTEQLDLQPKNEPLGGFSYSAKPTLLAFNQTTGTCPVWMETIEYRDIRRESYVLGTMSVLTKNLTVHVSRVGAGSQLTFEGGVMATGTKDEPLYGPNSLTLRYTGWLFEDHGYYVWWWDK